MKKTHLAILTMVAVFASVASAGATQFIVGPPVRQGTPEIVAVPESGRTLAMLAIGVLALAALRRKLAK
jgi:hypothetical protein